MIFCTFFSYGTSLVRGEVVHAYPRGVDLLSIGLLPLCSTPTNVDFISRYCMSIYIFSYLYLSKYIPMHLPCCYCYYGRWGGGLLIAGIGIRLLLNSHWALDSWKVAFSLATPSSSRTFWRTQAVVAPCTHTLQKLGFTGGRHPLHLFQLKAFYLARDHLATVIALAALIARVLGKRRQKRRELVEL